MHTLGCRVDGLYGGMPRWERNGGEMVLELGTVTGAGAWCMVQVHGADTRWGAPVRRGLFRRWRSSFRKSPSRRRFSFRELPRGWNFKAKSELVWLE